VVEGDEGQIRKTFDLVKEIHDEPPVVATGKVEGKLNLPE